MPIKIVFVCLLDQGHLQIPCAIGKSLLFRDAKNEIYFVCDEENHKRIKGKCSAFKTLVFDSSEMPNLEVAKRKFESSMMDNKERFKDNALKFGKLVDVWKNRAESVQNLINQVDPDLVICENLFNLPFIMSMKYKWAFIVSTNPLKIGDQISHPPMGSGIGKNSADFQWYVDTYRECGIDFRNKLDNFYKEWGLERKPSLSHIQPSPWFNVCMYPKMLNYFNPETDLDGNWLQLNSAIVKDEVKKFINDQGWATEKVNGKQFLTDEFLRRPGKLILFSMGTLVSENVELFNKIMPEIAACPHKFIVSKGSKGDEWKLPDNCVGANNVNQLELLPLVDLFITHGGNNSFTEALHFATPMIIIPVMGDQYDNACRLEQFELGKKVNLRDISTEKLCEAIDYVVDNETLKKRLKEISEIVQKDDSMDKLCDLVIETCLK